MHVSIYKIYTVDTFFTYFASWSVLVKLKEKHENFVQQAKFVCFNQHISSLVRVLYCTRLPPLTHHTTHTHTYHTHTLTPHSLTHHTHSYTHTTHTPHSHTTHSYTHTTHTTLIHTHTTHTPHSRWILVHMPSSPDVEQQMAEVLSRISDTLDTHSPPNGGIDAKKLLASPAQSPAVSRRFFFDPLSRERRSCVEPIIQDRCSCIEPITAEVHLSPRSCQSLGEIRSGIASQRYVVQ